MLELDRIVREYNVFDDEQKPLVTEFLKGALSVSPPIVIYQISKRLNLSESSEEDWMLLHCLADAVRETNCSNEVSICRFFSTLLTAQDPALRQVGATALSSIGGDFAINALKKRASREKDPHVKATINSLIS